MIVWQSIDHFLKDRLLRDDQSKQERNGGESMCSALSSCLTMQNNDVRCGIKRLTLLSGSDKDKSVLWTEDRSVNLS